jgi:hypothetical protein
MMDPAAAGEGSVGEENEKGRRLLPGVARRRHMWVGGWGPRMVIYFKLIIYLSCEASFGSRRLINYVMY